MPDKLPFQMNVPYLFKIGQNFHTFGAFNLKDGIVHYNFRTGVWTKVDSSKIHVRHIPRNLQMRVMPEGFPLKCP